MTEEEMQSAEELRRAEVGDGLDSDAPWLKWLKRCELMYFGRDVSDREQGFDGSDEVEGYSIDKMYVYFCEGLEPYEAVRKLPRGTLMTTETFIPRLDAYGLKYQLSIVDSIPFIEQEPWQRQIRAKILFTQKHGQAAAAAPASVKKARAKPGAKAARDLALLQQTILESGDAEMIALARKTGLIA